MHLQQLQQQRKQQQMGTELEYHGHPHVARRSKDLLHHLQLSARVHESENLHEQQSVGAAVAGMNQSLLYLMHSRAHARGGYAHETAEQMAKPPCGDPDS